jgi:hypothetical protein
MNTYDIRTDTRAIEKRLERLERSIFSEDGLIVRACVLENRQSDDEKTFIEVEGKLTTLQPLTSFIKNVPFAWGVILFGLVFMQFTVDVGLRAGLIPFQQSTSCER